MTDRLVDLVAEASYTIENLKCRNSFSFYINSRLDNYTKGKDFIKKLYKEWEEASKSEKFTESPPPQEHVRFCKQQ